MAVVVAVVAAVADNTHMGRTHPAAAAAVPSFDGILAVAAAVAATGIARFAGKSSSSAVVVVAAAGVVWVGIDRS